jgi:cytochrome P450
MSNIRLGGSVSASDLYYDPYDVEIDKDPYPTYKRLRDEAPLYYNERLDFWGLSRRADVEAALKDYERFSSAKGDILEVVKAAPQMPPGIFINEDPPVHTVHRALVARMFTPKRVRELEEKIRNFCTATLDPLVGGDRFDFAVDLANELPMRTIGMLIGIPDADQPSLRAHANSSLRSSEPGKPLNVTKDHYFNGFDFTDYIAWRQSNPSDDLITELLTIEFEDTTGRTRKLAKEEMLIFLAVIAGAGVETTSNLFGWMGKVLAEHPDQRAELVANPGLVPNAIEEILRFEPPGPHVARYVTEDTELHGQTVPAGSALLLMLASSNRDDRHVDDPDTFNVHRRAAHLTFGYGTHFCIGAPLARLEGRIGLEEVLRRWPSWEVDTANAVRKQSTTVRGWDSLPVFLK